MVTSSFADASEVRLRLAASLDGPAPQGKPEAARGFSLAHTNAPWDMSEEHAEIFGPEHDLVKEDFSAHKF